MKNFFVAWLFFCFLVGRAHAAPETELSPQKYGFTSITLSGISSGAFMGLQLMLTNSSSLDGVALVAGGPYLCAMASPFIAIQVCMKKPESVDLEKLAALISASDHDDFKNLDGKRIHFYHGLQDSVVQWKSSLKATELIPLINKKTQVSLHLLPNMAHTWPTQNVGSACLEEKSPWMGQCEMDFAGMALLGLYGPLKAKKAVPTDSFVTLEVESSPAAFLAKTAVAYVPQICKTEPCSLHVSLHGCAMNQKTIGDLFIKKSGLNEWAESNRIVVLYPQVSESDTNPHACWDWFGYTGTNYAKKQGVQQEALMTLISQLRQKLKLRESPGFSQTTPL